MSNQSTRHVPRQDYQAVLLYILTLFGFGVTMFIHLGFATDYEWDITLPLLFEMFPIFALFIAMSLLIIAIVVVLSHPLAGARLAFAASIAAWLYYGVMSCVMTLAFSLLPFVTLEGFFMLIVPTVLLFITTRYARQRIHNRSDAETQS